MTDHDDLRLLRRLGVLLRRGHLHRHHPPLLLHRTCRLLLPVRGDGVLTLSLGAQDKKEHNGVAVHMTLEKVVGSRAIKAAELKKSQSKGKLTQPASNQA